MAAPSLSPKSRIRWRGGEFGCRGGTAAVLGDQHVDVVIAPQPGFVRGRERAAGEQDLGAAAAALGASLNRTRKSNASKWAKAARRRRPCCVTCGAPVGDRDRQHCCRCCRRMQEQAAKAPCPACSKDHVLQQDRPVHPLLAWNSAAMRSAQPRCACAGPSIRRAPGPEHGSRGQRPEGAQVGGSRIPPDEVAEGDPRSVGQPLVVELGGAGLLGGINQQPGAAGVSVRCDDAMVARRLTPRAVPAPIPSASELHAGESSAPLLLWGHSLVAGPLRWPWRFGEARRRHAVARCRRPEAHRQGCASQPATA